MKANKTNEMLEQYSAPMCKVVKTVTRQAILTVSNETMDLDEGGNLFSIDY